MKEFFLNETELKKAILDYYFGHEPENIDVVKELKIVDDEIVITFSMVEYADDDRLDIVNKIDLTDEDLKAVYGSYLGKRNYNLESSLFMGGIRNVGYYTDEATPIFEGVQLKGTEKGVQRKLRVFNSGRND